MYGSTGHFCQACGALEQRAVSIGDVEPEAFFAKLYATSWVVYAKRPFGGAEQVIRYLSRYTHRVAISNARIEDVATDGVRFRTKTGQQVTLAPEEFLRRLLLHVLPKGFTKIRHFGLLAAGPRVAAAMARVAARQRGARVLANSVVDHHTPHARTPFRDILNGYFRTIDHHDESVGVWETAITTGARFSLPPDAPIRPWIAPRLVHLHFFEDRWSDHGVDGHAALNRWGLGAALGFDIGLGGPSSRWRFGFDAEALALSGPGINLLVHTIAIIGVGF